MEKVKVELENCYGIRKLNAEFDFSEKSTYAIYAPNGVMKTSFAKTFLDLAEGRVSSDTVFKQRMTKRSIQIEDDSDLAGGQVFVIVPYDQAFRSTKISSLLVNQELKTKYEEIHAIILEKREALLTELRQLSGVKKDLAEIISMDFVHTDKDFYKAVGRVKLEVQDSNEPELVGISYQSIFNDKVIAFLETPEFRAKLEEYITKYNELIDSSTYFKKGVFNHNNAAAIAKNLKDNGFFDASHSVSLNSTEDKLLIESVEELETVIQDEKDTILSDAELTSAFNNIDKAITKNQDLKTFRRYIEDHPEILPELQNLQSFRQRLWISYFKLNRGLYDNLMVEFEKGQQEIEEIVEQAKQEETDWRKVINEFNDRFYVPFKLSVENQEDVILKSDGPSIKFTFQDSEGSTDIEEGQLFDTLSNGELRALYILNILFEVEARKRSNQETVFVVDDIADSFDYKNKYAIIEYLKDISEVDIFNQIILTHNFDFYRTVCSRLNTARRNKLHSSRVNGEIILQQETYQNNPFSHWKDKMGEPGFEAMLIASIPFVRNLAEYAGHVDDFNVLTSLLHVKENTLSIKVRELETVFKNILKDKADLSLNDQEMVVTEMIFRSADLMLPEEVIQLELESKIVLAIAIRLKLELYLIDNIQDETFWKSITSNQTHKLIQRFSADFPEKKDQIRIANQVNLMTPENIHLNSFMYEPIIDLSNDHLKQLYQQVKALNG